MITIKSGELLVKRYNKENNTQLTPKEFFKSVIAPLLFYGNRHLVCWQNSKFSQYINKNKIKLQTEGINAETFNNILNDFCEAIDNPRNNVLTTLNIFGGCAIPKYGVTTLFSYSDNLDFNQDERYCSFIGSSVALLIEGWCVILDNEDVIWEIFKGIEKYRQIIDTNENLSGNQIYAWNTIYLFNKYLGDVDTICDEYFDDNGKLSLNIGSNGISFSNFLYLIQSINKDIKMLHFFNDNGHQTKSCTSVLIDLDYVSNQSKMFKQLYQTMNVDFKYANFNKIFGGKNLFYKAIETGCITKGFFNPLLDVKKNDKENIKKNRIKYIEFIMTEEQKGMALRLAKAIKDKMKENPRVVYNPDINFFDVKDTPKLIKNIANELKNPEDFMDLIDMISDSNFKSNDLNMFLAYSKYSFEIENKKK